MTMPRRTVNIDAAAINPELAKGATFIFRNVGVESSDNEVLMQTEFSAVTDEDTLAAVSLPVKSEGSIFYECEIKVGYKKNTPFYFYLENGSAINLSELHGGGSAATVTTQSYTNNAIATKAVRFDTAQTLSDEQKAQARDNIGAGTGGGVSTEEFDAEIDIIEGALQDIEDDIEDLQTDKQNALGYTPENSANKSTDVNTDQSSNTKFPSVKAVYDWAIGLFLRKSNNLSDLQDAAAARTNLGLGSLATQSGTFSGTSSGTNTGDESASSIKSKLGITTLSGSNTGDQDLSGLATTSAVNSALAGKQDVLPSFADNGSDVVIDADSVTINATAGASINSGTENFPIGDILVAGNGTRILVSDGSNAVQAFGDFSVNSNEGGAGKFQITNPQTPASASASGIKGQIAWDANFLYVCVNTNQWHRIAHSTW